MWQEHVTCEQTDTVISSPWSSPPKLVYYYKTVMIILSGGDKCSREPELGVGDREQAAGAGDAPCRGGVGAASLKCT